MAQQLIGEREAAKRGRNQIPVSALLILFELFFLCFPRDFCSYEVDFQ